MSVPLLSVSAPPPAPIDLDEGLRRFGHTSFRPGQREAMEALLEHGSLLLVAPTGGGKSLTYQLPAALLPGTTLVVSPLVALMHDQVEHLRAAGVPATYLASTLPADEARRRMASVAAGEFKLVYAAPERLVYPGFRTMLQRLGLSLVAVDEAHCISEWGHDFRPEYLRIGALVSELQPPRVLACTATATPIVRDEIVTRLGLPADTPQVVRGFARPNLSLRVIELARAKDRSRHVDDLLASALGDPSQRAGAAIVYAPTRRTCEEEARRLERQGWKAGAYHAGLTGTRRDRVQQAFMNNKLGVVVATNAFGMGIDRADVRAVVHLSPPGSVEAYYQEVGRAGRDGEPAYGLMMVSANDMPLRRRLLESPSGDSVPAPEVVEHKWNLFLELMRWAEGGSCRHDAILRYFGDEAETLHGCGRCDVCQDLDQAQATEEETTELVRKALSGVARVHGRFGLQAAVKLLLGQDDDRLRRAGLDRVRTFGVLGDQPEAWVTRLLRRCVTAGWVDFSGERRPVVFLTDPGKQVMRGARPARLLLPARTVAGSKGKRGNKRGPSRPSTEELPAEARSLFESLRSWRLDLAKHDGVPPYVIASDRTLRDIALLRPATLDQLALAHGIGPTKLERYGQQLLSAIRHASPSTEMGSAADGLP